MRHGLRSSATKLLGGIFNELDFKMAGVLKLTTPNLCSWQQVFITLSKLNLSNESSYLTKDRVMDSDRMKEYGWRLGDQSILTPHLRSYNTTQSAYSIFYRNIKIIEPMYNFYVYRVAKKIYKNTRGKSGRYTFIWKYVSPYKRVYATYYWLLRELGLRTERRLKDRLRSLISSLMLYPTSLWAARVGQFALRYTYRHCRLTLAETYRSVSK